MFPIGPVAEASPLIFAVAHADAFVSVSRAFVSASAKMETLIVPEN